MAFAEFDVVGPYELKQGNHDHLFTRANIKALWEAVDEDWDPPISCQAGCYVFAIRTGRGILPWYVGKRLGNFVTKFGASGFWVGPRRDLVRAVSDGAILM